MSALLSTGKTVRATVSHGWYLVWWRAKQGDPTKLVVTTKTKTYEIPDEIPDPNGPLRIWIGGPRYRDDRERAAGSGVALELLPAVGRPPSVECRSGGRVFVRLRPDEGEVWRCEALNRASRACDLTSISVHDQGGMLAIGFVRWGRSRPVSRASWRVERFPGSATHTPAQLHIHPSEVAHLGPAAWGAEQLKRHAARGRRVLDRDRPGRTRSTCDAACQFDRLPTEKPGAVSDASFTTLGLAH